jgi:hypothetical protein
MADDGGVNEECPSDRKRKKPDNFGGHSGAGRNKKIADVERVTHE